MKIAWIYPYRQRCGISLYSGRYCDALDKRIHTRSFDPADILQRLNDSIAQINRCDLVHIQYETSFFMKDNGNFYERLLEAIKLPVIVSLHEVYRTIPGVFPREAIKGSFLSVPLKRILYDYRHPMQTAYRKHAAQAFYAKVVLVHQEYHKKILQEQRVPVKLISVLPHPVKIVPLVSSFPSWETGRPAHCVASGYINPQYDYDLLFAALRELSIPWRFTWIGGVRRSEDEALLSDIKHKVRLYNWHDRFQITGWLPEEELVKTLCTADIFCALFSARSSSGSLATAIGALRPIIATKLPLTREIASHGVLHCVDAKAEAVAKGIEKILTDKPLRGLLETKGKEYREKYHYDAMADKMIAIYKKVLDAKLQSR